MAKSDPAAARAYVLHAEVNILVAAIEQITQRLSDTAQGDE